jgi:hypothetical protein
MIAFISTLILANFSLVGYFGAKAVSMISLKYYRKVRRFIDPEYMRI